MSPASAQIDPLLFLKTTQPNVIFAVDLDKPGDIRRLGGVHTGARFPSISPDGTLVSYVSGEIGRDEIFLTQFPSGEEKIQISTDGGGWTLFSPTGNAVLYPGMP